MSPKRIDVSSLDRVVGAKYPPPFDRPIAKRVVQRIAAAGGLTQFGVTRVLLPPGAWSSQRHWHEREDELVYVLDGELVLVTDGGEETLRAGDAAAFKAGVRDGHHLQNRSEQDAVFLVVGTRDDADSGEYPDIDMVFGPNRYSGQGSYRRKDGTEY